MIADGAVAKSVATNFLAESIIARGVVMKDYAEAVKFR